MPRRRRKEKNLLLQHPAETAGAVTGWSVATGLVQGFGLEGWAASLVYLAATAVPLAWTFVVKNGGLVGLIRKLLRGG